MLSPNQPNSGIADSKYFIGPLKGKKKNVCVLKTFPRVTDYFNVKVYFSNACLNSVEHIYYFPQQNIRRTDAWFQVSGQCYNSFSTIFPFHINMAVGSKLTATWLPENLWK